MQRRAAETSSPEDERALYQDTLAEYCWARDVAGLAPATLHALVQPVMEICAFYGVVPWRLGPREVDQHFAGVGKRGHSTIRAKMTKIDGYFAFLEQRYAGEILDGSELWSSLRWTRSIGHDTVATSGFGSRRPPGR